VPGIDCHDPETALRSVADVLRIDRRRLRASLLAYDERAFDVADEDPFRLMPNEVLAGFGIDIDTVVIPYACFFHGSRVLDPNGFRRDGILPLDRMIEPIWSELRSFTCDVCSDAEWSKFRRWVEDSGGGHGGFLYRLKTGDRMHFGPQALTVRQVLVEPDQTPSHDYLGCPEIIEDIASCFETAHGVDLRTRFCDASHPVIVKFTSTNVWNGVLPTALWYVYDWLRDGELTSQAGGGFDGAGAPVSPDDVIEVERVAGRR
jgi:hypothetical protein